MLPWNHLTSNGRKEQDMLKSKIASIVDNCSRYAWAVVAVAAILALITAAYTARNFSINTDINKLISPDLPWRQREIAVSDTFVDRNASILAVVEAPSSEFATAASTALTEALKAQPTLFMSVDNTAEDAFFT